MVIRNTNMHGIYGSLNGKIDGFILEPAGPRDHKPVNSLMERHQVQCIFDILISLHDACTLLCTSAPPDGARV